MGLCKCLSFTDKRDDLTVDSSSEPVRAPINRVTLCPKTTLTHAAQMVAEMI